jgi:hypothetical protein
MNRVLVLIAVIFVLAGVTGPAMARATVPASWSAVSDQCLEPEAAAEAPAFKPCGKKVNGLAVPCSPSPAVMPLAGVFLPEPGRPQFPVISDAPRRFTVFEGRFRPPRA